MLYRFNVTGRKFLCVNRDSELLDQDQDHFKAGKTYVEAIVDNDVQNHTDENTLLLRGDHDIALYVNSEDFILLDETIPYIIRLNTFCLN